MINEYLCINHLIYAEPEAVFKTQTKQSKDKIHVSRETK